MKINPSGKGFALPGGVFLFAHSLPSPGGRWPSEARSDEGRGAVASI